MKTHPSRTTYIVCNADSKTGLGHLLRCLSLASQLKRLQQSICLVGHFSDTAQAFIETLKISYNPVQSHLIAIILQSLPNNAQIVLDSYDYQLEDLRTEQHYVLIDDFCRLGYYPVLGVINFTFNATQYDYQNKGAASQALGLNYFLPHPRLKPSRQIFNPDPKKLLIVIGSGDPFQLTIKLLGALNSLNHPLVIRVLTPNNFHVQSKHTLDVYPLQQDINPFFQWADVLITSGGLAKYEAAYVHKPAVVFSQTAGELSETKDFAKADLCFDFGLAESFDGMSFAEKFEKWLSDTAIRKNAFETSHQLFKADSALHAANYVQACFNRSSYEGNL